MDKIEYDVLSTLSERTFTTQQLLAGSSGHSETGDHAPKKAENDIIVFLAGLFDVERSDILDIQVLKKGMTNRSFLFSCKGRKYIMRIPGEGTDQLISRQNEAHVYKAISGSGLCDEPVYIDPESGFKITEFLDGIRVCDPESDDDLQKCMKKLREFHRMELKVEHEFDIFKQIVFYQGLWNGTPSLYKDHKTTTKNVLSLKGFIDANTHKKCLTHIDAVPDNFLFHDRGNGEELQLTDWEYAGMQDPHVDVAMFCIYSLYDRASIDKLIDIYFENNCDKATRIKIYCYIAACGLLWSNWCEYKRCLGVEFGEYSLRQYQYAKDYFKIACEEMETLE